MARIRISSIVISSIVGAPAGAVRERVRDFGGLPGWRPLIGESRIGNGEPLEKPEGG